MTHVFFNGWEPLLRTIVVGLLAYASLVLLLRVSGKRTLSKMNAFDFIVTIALGSTLATILLSKEVSLAQGLVAFGLLIGLQFTVTGLSVRSLRVRTLITGEPQMLFYNGAFIQSALRASRVTEDEVLAAIRASGSSDQTTVHAVILETDASFSVVARNTGPVDVSTLDKVRGHPDARDCL
jgi:uncharacterized membrane protein YcaP (DUF421 family)